MKKILVFSIIVGLMLMSVGIVVAGGEGKQIPIKKGYGFIEKYDSESVSYKEYHGNGIYSITHVVRYDAVKPDRVKPPKPDKTTGPACYELMGVSWAVKPDYVAQDDKLLGIATISIRTWDASTGFDLLGEGNVNTEADFGDISNPVMDGENSYSRGDYPSDGVIAVCRTWWRSIGGITEIMEYDIMFDTDFAWGDATTDSSLMDYQNIATHEIGHAFGLFDVYQRPCRKVTMFGYSSYGEVSKRDLAPQDITGLQMIYGA